MGLAAGSTYFSDGNHRPFLRTRWNYSLDEQYGLNAYLKTRSYRNSDPDRPQYFSPQWLNEASLGLSPAGLPREHVVLSAALDAGMQYTNADNQPIWGAFLGLASPRNAAIRWNIGLLATNTASLLHLAVGRLPLPERDGAAERSAVAGARLSARRRPPRLQRIDEHAGHVEAGLLRRSPGSRSGW